MTTEEIIEKSRKETAEHIKILQAFVDGKAIEDNCWEENPNNTFLPYEYIAVKE